MVQLFLPHFCPFLFRVKSIGEGCRDAFKRALEIVWALPQHPKSGTSAPPFVLFFTCFSPVFVLFCGRDPANIARYPAVLSLFSRCFYDVFTRIPLIDRQLPANAPGNARRYPRPGGTARGFYGIFTDFRQKCRVCERT